MKNKIKIGTEYYPVIGQVQTRCGTYVSLADLSMMSDEKWNELARENAIHNYRREFGKEPDNPEQAVKWQREHLCGGGMK